MDSLFGGSIYRNVSIAPVHAYVRTLREETANAVGMIDCIACQSFEPADTHGLDSISANVESFTPKVTCELANATWRPSPGHAPVFQLDSQTCSVGPADQSPLKLSIGQGQTVAHGLSRVNCSEPDGMEKWSVLTAQTPYDYRFAVVVGDVSHLNLTIVGDSNPDFNSEPLDKLIPQQTTAVICKTDYSIHRSVVMQDFTSSVISLQQLETLPTLQNLTGTMLAELIFASITDPGLTGFGTPGSDLDTSRPIADASPFFSVLLQTLKGDQSEGDLKASMEQVWAGLGSHIVRESFLSPTVVDANGTSIHKEDRLLVGVASLWIMVAGFGIVIVLAISIMLTTSQGVPPRDPGMISTDAIALSVSPKLQDILEKCHSMRTSQMTETLRGIIFTNAGNDNFSTDTEDGRRPKGPLSIKSKKKDWIPLPARYPMFVLTLTLPLAAIVTLELLFRISEAHDGFADVSGSEDTATYLSRYGSALKVLLIATCFNALDFTTSLFAPYSCLRSGPIPASRGISFQILGSLPPIALIKSMRGGHASSFTSNIAGMLGSILTIIASGLWVVDRTVIMQQSATVTLSNAWDIDWYNSSISGDGGAGVMLDQSQHGSTSLPSLMIQDVVLPEISNIKLPQDGAPTLAHWESDTSTHNFTFQLEALRPLLTCKVVNDEDVAISFTEGQNSFLRNVFVRATPSPPSGCQHDGTDGVYNTYDFSSEFFFTGGNESHYMGNFYDLHLGPWTSDFLEYGERGSYITDRQPDNPAGCPSIAVILGRISRYDVDHDDVTALYAHKRCSKCK
jgi:hypothetical protein